MALADSNLAIGAVTRLLIDHVTRRTSLNITARHPRAAAGSNTNPKLNLFLFETVFDPQLKNFSLTEGEPAPLWLSLRYALTAFDTEGASDTAEAHELIGRGMAALQEVNFLRLDNSVDIKVRHALENNPELLKLTFDEATPDLISKLMDGPDETYRFSISFQVRPVMIVPGEPPHYSQLVGVNYEPTPNVIIGEEGLSLTVLSSLGPVLESIDPETFAASAVDADAPIVEIRGNNLHLSNLECLLGNTPLPIVAQRPDRLSVRIGSTVAAGTTIAAGEHPVVVRQLLAIGRYRSSNLLTARLRPTLDSLTSVFVVNPGPPPTVSGNLTLTGNLLGRDVDDVRVAFAQNGTIVRVGDITAPAVTDQTALTVPLPSGGVALSPGVYRVFLIVNGVQASNSPTVVLL
jgi:hypothetical protein